MGDQLKNVAIRMVEAPPLYSEEKLKEPLDVVRVLGRELETYDREVACVVNLRADLAPINMNIVSMGSVNASIITAREVFKSSILSNAAFIMLVHNHPSGRLTPSRQDIKLTGQIEKAAQLLNIPLLDHVILGHRGEFFSFHANGLLAADKDKLEAAAEEKGSICGESGSITGRKGKTGTSRRQEGERRGGRGAAGTGRRAGKSQRDSFGKGGQLCRSLTIIVAAHFF